MTSEESFDLVFLPVYLCRFIPMNFSGVNGSVREPNLRDALPLAPAILAIELSKTSHLVNSRPNRERFNLRNWAEQLKVHDLMVPKLHCIRQRES